MPIENTKRSTAPCRAVVDVAATSNIDAKIGPIHGTQPNANDAPNRKDDSGDPFLNAPTSLCVFCNSGILRTSSMNNPNTITKIPPTFVRMNLYSAKTFVPKNAAATPMTTNTTVNPRTYRNPFHITLRRRALLFFADFRSAGSTPLINAKYAGTSGNVHGAKNIRKPAINAESVIRPL